MKKIIVSLLVAMIILFLCKGISLLLDKDGFPQRLQNYVECSNSVVDSISLRIYTPKYSSIHLYCGDSIPDGDNMSQLYCASAAFTGVGYEDGFKHNIIAGDHVSQGKRYEGYICKRNTGAFVYYNGKYKFLYQDYSNELDSAAKNNGLGFAQEMMIHKGQAVKTTRPRSNENQFRALCEKDEKICIVESENIVTFGQFIDSMLKLGVTEALYLDMGGWSYSWYRDQKGNVLRPFPDGKEVLSNAIVFEGLN